MQYSRWNSVWFQFKIIFLDFFRICLEVQKQRYHSPTTVTLLVVVIIFIICQSARCAANLTDAILFLKLSPECQKDEDYVSMDGWSVMLHTWSNILLAINRYHPSYRWNIKCKKCASLGFNGFIFKKKLKNPESHLRFFTRCLTCKFISYCMFDHF